METSLVTRYKTIKLYGLSEEEVRESIQDLVEKHSEIGFLVAYISYFLLLQIWKRKQR